MSRRFNSQEFNLAPHAESFELDAEVAARIASGIWTRNKPGWPGNNYEVTEFQVDPTGVLVSDGPNRPRIEEDEPTFITSFEAEREAVEANNGLFAQAVQTAFDRGERRNRASIGFGLGLIGVPLAGAGVAETIALSNGESGTAIGVGAGTAAWLAIFGPAATQHIYRRTITNPRSGPMHKYHMHRAEKIAAKLKLPPVITAS